MTIFRSKKNGLLYTIEHNRAPKYTGSWYQAVPYKHSTPAYPRKKRLDKSDLENFEVVATA